MSVDLARSSNRFVAIGAALLVATAAAWVLRVRVAEAPTAPAQLGTDSGQALPGFLGDPLLRLLDPAEDVYPRGRQVLLNEMSNTAEFLVPSPPRADLVPDALKAITPGRMGLD